MKQAEARKRKLWSGLVAAFAVGLLASSSYAAEWSDTEVQFVYGTRFREPFNPAGAVDPSRPWDNDTDVTKSILTLQHASGHKYGSNFFFVDFLNSVKNDPIGGGSFGEIYGEWYTSLSLNKTTGVKLDWGIVRDLSLTGGVNYGAKSNGANPRVLLLGPTVNFNLPGFVFFNVDVLAYRDTGRFAGTKSTDDTTWQISPAWLSKFNLGPTHWVFTGHVDFIGKRCPVAPASCDGRTTEILAQPELKLDVGRFWSKPDTIYAGLEYNYWRNKFGLKGLNESNPQLQLAWKF
jgi:nucleoside-specific outer membrane channel protein Tsx